jgi:hypothetical protein
MKNKLITARYPIIKIVWRDANQFAKERDVVDALKTIKIDMVTTIGFLIGYDGKNPIVSRDYMEVNKAVRNSIVIPVENIISLERY